MLRSVLCGVLASQANIAIRSAIDKQMAIVFVPILEKPPYCIPINKAPANPSKTATTNNNAENNT